jgi:DNA-binding CsgD family transcriptional regulator
MLKELERNIDAAVETGRNDIADQAPYARAVVHAAGLLGLLDQIDYGLMVVDRRHVALHANSAGCDWLAAPGAPLVLREGRLEAAFAEDAGALRRAVSDASTRGLQTLLALGRGEDRTNIAVVPAAARDLPGAALLLFGRSRVCEELTAQVYGARHGLTYAESQVLRLLYLGCPPASIARQQRVAVSTVRTQISSIRAKTGCTNTQALLRRLALLPPLVHALRGLVHEGAPVS